MKLREQEGAKRVEEGGRRACGCGHTREYRASRSCREGGRGGSCKVGKGGDSPTPALSAPCRSPLLADESGRRGWWGGERGKFRFRKYITEKICALPEGWREGRGGEAAYAEGRPRERRHSDASPPPPIPSFSKR